MDKLRVLSDFNSSLEAASIKALLDEAHIANMTQDLAGNLMMDPHRIRILVYESDYETALAILHGKEKPIKNDNIPQTPEPENNYQEDTEADFENRFSNTFDDYHPKGSESYETPDPLPSKPKLEANVNKFLLRPIVLLILIRIVIYFLRHS